MDELPDPSDIPPDPAEHSETFHAHQRWRREEDPIIVEATEAAEGWRHLTIRHAPRGIDGDPRHFSAMSRVLGMFQRLAGGRPSSAEGGRVGDRKVIVMSLGPPDADEDISRLHELAQKVNTGSWEISYSGRPLPGSF